MLLVQCNGAIVAAIVVKLLFLSAYCAISSLKLLSYVLK